MLSLTNGEIQADPKRSDWQGQWPGAFRKIFPRGSPCVITLSVSHHPPPLHHRQFYRFHVAHVDYQVSVAVVEEGETQGLLGHAIPSPALGRVAVGCLFAIPNGLPHHFNP